MRHHHPALLHRHALTMDRLLAFLMAFSTVVLKLSLSQILFLSSHQFLLQAHSMEFDHSTLAVTGDGSVGERRSCLLGALWT